MHSAGRKATSEASINRNQVWIMQSFCCEGMTNNFRGKIRGDGKQKRSPPTQKCLNAGAAGAWGCSGPMGRHSSGQTGRLLAQAAFLQRGKQPCQALMGSGDLPKPWPACLAARRNTCTEVGTFPTHSRRGSRRCCHLCWVRAMDSHTCWLLWGKKIRIKMNFHLIKPGITFTTVLHNNTGASPHWWLNGMDKK